MDRILVVCPLRPVYWGFELMIDNEKSLNYVLPYSTSRAGSLCGFVKVCLDKWKITSSYWSTCWTSAREFEKVWFYWFLVRFGMFPSCSQSYEANDQILTLELHLDNHDEFLYTSLLCIQHITRPHLYSDTTWRLRLVLRQSIFFLHISLFGSGTHYVYMLQCSHASALYYYYTDT
jgi:hypothetical protein